MAGFAKRMYAMVKNVARAPRASRATVVPRADNWKNASMLGMATRAYFG
jgi:hypothetical protein